MSSPLSQPSSLAITADGDGPAVATPGDTTVANPLKTKKVSAKANGSHANGSILWSAEEVSHHWVVGLLTFSSQSVRASGRRRTPTVPIVYTTALLGKIVSRL